MTLCSVVVVCFLLGNSPASEFYVPGNSPEESIQHSEDGERLKSKMFRSPLHAIYSSFPPVSLLFHFLLVYILITYLNRPPQNPTRPYDSPLPLPSPGF